MSLRLYGLVFCLFYCPTGTPVATELPPVAAAQHDIHCREDSEYPNGNICCLNCPPGKRVVAPCTAEGHRGRCEECDFGTYMEHSNGLARCFRCTQCHSDQDAVVDCSPTHDRKCECKAGRFCTPDEACEVCRKCSSCREDEELVRNCTPMSNSECKKVQSPTKPGSASTDAIAIIVPLSILALIVCVSIVVCVRLRCWKAGAGRSLMADHSLIPGRPFGDSRAAVPSHLVRSKPSAQRIAEERKTLCESLSSSASNSQHSLVVPARSAIPLAPSLFTAREEPFPHLVAVNGEDSLRRCFDYFVQMDIGYHRRFFRSLGLDDNVIKSKEVLEYEDRIHELLSVWIEKTGREANINQLLRPLLELDQRRTAENIKERALESGHYRLDQS